MTRWRCTDCGAITATEGPIALDAEFRVNVCPACQRVNQFIEVCDESGCELKATCGWYADDGEYRRTCMTHAEWP